MRARSSPGIASAAMTAMIAITINSSTSVNPEAPNLERRVARRPASHVRRERFGN
jgi:hypothetical protein